MIDTHSTPQKRSPYPALLLTWTLSAGYFILSCLGLSTLHDSIIKSIGVSGAGILALMVPSSTALFSTFLIPRWWAKRFVTCCAFSFPTPSLLCIGSTFLIPYGIPNRELYVSEVIALGLLTSLFGTIIGWTIRRRK